MNDVLDLNDWTRVVRPSPAICARCGKEIKLAHPGNKPAYCSGDCARFAHPEWTSAGKEKKE